MEMVHFSDAKLYELCRDFGAQALRARNKFVALLPEVKRRELFRKHGFESIFHFAKVLAGVSEEQVRRVLNIEEKFKKAPALKQLLESGEVSVNKLARVASVADEENDEFWAMQVNNLSQKALETMIRDDASVRAHTQPQQNSAIVKKHAELTDEVHAALVELQEKGIDINALILETLRKRMEEIETEKTEIAQKIEDRQNDGVISSRYIPVEINRLVEREFGTKCAVPTCQRNSEHLHHTNRFSLSKNHDPRFLAPLCKAHHEIAHKIDVKYAVARGTKYG
ncbi:hypothetical protein KBD59_06090 [Candidatus Gracilibacteria bacterium]|nr:hypothetical protein [Candidatus Gracilibacteria bacterium]